MDVEEEAKREQRAVLGCGKPRILAAKRYSSVILPMRGRTMVKTGRVKPGDESARAVNANINNVDCIHRSIMQLFSSSNVPFFGIVGQIRGNKSVESLLLFSFCSGIGGK